MERDEYLNTINYYKSFHAIATRAYSSVMRLVDKRKRYSSKPELSDADIDIICEKNAEIQRQAMIVVVFSVMTLESFINHYGIYYSTRNFFLNYLDKLSLKGKWAILPRLVTRQLINTESQEYESFIKLIKLRDKLVHDKTRKKITSELRDSDWVTERDATNAITAVQGMVNSLKALDSNPAINIDWLNEAESDRFA